MFVVVNGGCCGCGDAGVLAWLRLVVVLQAAMQHRSNGEDWIGLQQYSQPVGTTQHGGRAFSRRWRTAAAALPNRSYSDVVEYLRTRLQYSCDVVVVAFFTSLQEF